MKKQKGFTLGIVLILCLSLFACKNSEDTVYSNNITNQKAESTLEQTEKTETEIVDNYNDNIEAEVPDSHKDLIGAWKPVNMEDTFYIFNEDGIVYLVSLYVGEDANAGKVGLINTFSYEVRGNSCKLAAIGDNYYGKDYTEECTFSRSDNQLKLGQGTLELIDSIDSHSLVGTWKPANDTELYIHIGNTIYHTESITFYNDGTFKLGNGNTGGPYLIIYDGAAVHLDTGGYDSEETVSIQMLGCGMMVIGEPGSQQLLKCIS